MIMAAEKRKSVGANNTPSKFAKNQQGRSPGGGPQGGNKFGKKSFGGQQSPGKPQQGKGGSPQKQQQKQQNQKEGKGQPQSAKKNTVPPPPPAGAKKIEVSKAETPAKATPKQQKKGKQTKAPLDKVSQNSKNIQKKHIKKSRFQRFTDKLAQNPRPAGACERAFKAEQELGHGGRVYLIKVADPPITEKLVKSWNTGIEAAVFSKSVEPRQFLVIFKHDADVTKGVEALKKTKFAGSNITVEEKLDSDVRVLNNPENVDPFCLYLTNIHADVTKEGLKQLFVKATTVTTPRKHNPRIGTSTKFCFIAFESANDALAAFKDNYNATLAGNTIVMRFRRVGPKEIKAMEAPKAPVAAAAAKKPAQQQTKAAKKEEKKPVKVEAEDSDEDDEEEDDLDVKVEGAEQDSDEEDDDDDDEELGVGEEDDDDDDDDDDDLDDDDDDDDDDE